MNFLANFLPGVRDARAPFLTGVLWALNVWLWFGPCKLLHGGTDNTMVERFRALPENFGPIPGTILVSLSIYLGGSILSSVAIWTWNLANAGSAKKAFTAALGHRGQVSDQTTETRKRRKQTKTPAAVWLDAKVFGVAKSVEEIEAWLRSHVRAAVARGATISQLLNSRIFSNTVVEKLQDGLAKIQEQSYDTWNDIERQWGFEGEASVQARRDEVYRASLTDAITTALSDEVLVRELPTHLTRLQLDQETIWNEYDRLRSEHELRVSLVPPTFVLSIVAMWQGGPLFASSLIIPLALFVQGSRLGRQAEAKVWSALVTGAIDSLSVREVDEWDSKPA